LHGANQPVCLHVMPTCAWEDFFTIDYMLHSCGAAQKTTEAKLFTLVPTLILHSFIYFCLDVIFGDSGDPSV